MSWHAVNAVEDAIDVTRGFLGGRSLGRWARLAVIAFFLGTGGVGGQFSSFSNLSGANGPPGGGGPPSGIPSADSVLAGVDLLPVVGVAGGAVAVWLLLGLVGSVMEFVFLAGLATDEVRVRAPFRRHARAGVQLFGFRLALTLPVAVPIVGGVVAVFTGVVDPSGVGGGTIAGVLIGLAVLAFLLGVVRSLTNQLVVPVMFAEERGVVDGWRRLGRLLGDQPWQTVAYVVVHLLIGVGVGVVRTFLLLIGAIPVTIAAVVVGLTAANVGGTFLGSGLVAGAVTWLVLLFVFVVLPVNVVAKTYTRAYELRALAGFDPSLAVLADGLGPTPTGRPGSGGRRPPGGDGSHGGDAHDTSGGHDTRATHDADADEVLDDRGDGARGGDETGDSGDETGDTGNETGEGNETDDGDGDRWA
mgnify:CR=1 FL=1